MMTDLELANKTRNTALIDWRIAHEIAQAKEMDYIQAKFEVMRLTNKEALK